MISINRATEKDYQSIVDIGRISVVAAHRDSCSAEQMNDFLERNYNDDAIKEELNETNNIYHIIHYDGRPGRADRPIPFTRQLTRPSLRCN